MGASFFSPPSLPPSLPNTSQPMEHGFRGDGDNTAPTLKQSDQGTQANTQANTTGLLGCGTDKGAAAPAEALDPAPIDYLKRSNVSRRACMICREKKSKWYVGGQGRGEGGLHRT